MIDAWLAGSGAMPFRWHNPSNSKAKALWALGKAKDKPKPRLFDQAYHQALANVAQAKLNAYRAQPVEPCQECLQLPKETMCLPCIQKWWADQNRDRQTNKWRLEFPPSTAMATELAYKKTQQECGPQGLGVKLLWGCKVYVGLRDCISLSLSLSITE